jgi:peptidyl-prolyl cis-trans isomerase SurA
MKTKRAATVLILAAAVVSFAAQDVVEEIVAVVNDDIITLSEYRQEFESTMTLMRAQLQGEAFERQYENLKNELLNMMITDILLMQKAREEAINVGEQLKMTIESIKEENNIPTDEDLRRALQQQGIGYNEWIAEMEENLKKQAVIFTEVDRSIVLDDSEIVQYYRRFPEEFTEPEEFQIRAVYLAPASADELEPRKQAVDAAIEAGDSLAAVAGTHSDPPLNEVEGNLGRFKKGELDPVLEDVVATLETGGISGWVETKNGWYRLHLEEKTPSRLRPFEDARKDVEEHLFMEKKQKKLDEFLKRLREQSYIKILKPNPLNL